MSVLAGQIQFVDVLQTFYSFEALLAEWRLAIKGVEHNAFQQVSKGHIMVFRESLEDLQQSLFKPHSGLNPLNFFGAGCCAFPCHFSPPGTK